MLFGILPPVIAFVGDFVLMLAAEDFLGWDAWRLSDAFEVDLPCLGDDKMLGCFLFEAYFCLP